MRFPHYARMKVTPRGEKQLRLGAFIARGIELMAAPTPGAAPRLLVIARSAQSPVVKSVLARAREVAGAGGTVRLILAKPEGAGLSEALVAAHAAALDCEVRLARNPRLIEAHEQLVIGGRICWTGDTMRRDPTASDAYESFVEDCPEIATAAAATFERLWVDCEPPAAGAIAAGALGTPKAIGPAAPLARRP